VLLDISAACGTQVIYLGNRSEGVYQRGLGVCAALLARNGIPMLSHRDHRSLGLVLSHVDATFTRDPDARDHHESDWYVANLCD
jgi:hypothetical protein